MLVAAALGAYAFFSLAWISLPGPEQDEVIFLNASFPQTSVTWYVGKVRLFHRDIPTMLLPYLGTLKGLLWRGVFWLWAPSVYSVRVPGVLLGGGALLVFYLWARRFYPPEVALAALALAATDPTYIFTARLDWGPVVLAHLFCFAGLLLGAQGLRGEADDGRAQHRSGRLRWLAGAGLCFGLGLWDKATFLWFLLALAAALLILFPRRVRAQLSPVSCAVFVAALLVGALPLAIYNVRARRSGTREAARVERWDRTKLKEKLHNLQTSLDGRFVYGWTGGWAMNQNVAYSVSDRTQLGLDALARLGPSRGTLLPWALLGALLVAAGAAGARLPILFPLLVSAFLWAQMLPIRNAGGGAHHFALAYPLPHLAVAAAAGWLWRRARRWGKRALGLSLLALLLTQIGWDARYLRAFRQTGGLWNWSDAIYQVAAYVNASRPDLLVNMDWGFTYPLLLLTRARIPQEDFYSRVAFGNPQDESAQVRQLVGLLQRPNTFFLFHSEAFDNFPKVRGVFERALEAGGMRARVVRAFYQRTGDRLAVLVAVQPAGTALSGANLDLRARPGNGPGVTPEPQGPPVELSFEPSQVSAGGLYTISCPALAGRKIDLKYLFDGPTPAVAENFCRLDSRGSATIRVPVPFRPGTIEVMAVRAAGARQWRPTEAKITVR